MVPSPQADCSKRIEAEVTAADGRANMSNPLPTNGAVGKLGM